MSERSTVLELEVEVLDVLVLGTGVWAARRLVVNELAVTGTINPAATRFARRVPVPGRASQGLEELGRVGHSTMMSGGPGNPPAGPRQHGSREPCNCVPGNRPGPAIGPTVSRHRTEAAASSRHS